MAILLPHILEQNVLLQLIFPTKALNGDLHCKLPLKGHPPPPHLLVIVFNKD